MCSCLSSQFRNRISGAMSVDFRTRRRHDPGVSPFPTPCFLLSTNDLSLDRVALSNLRPVFASRTMLTMLVGRCDSKSVTASVRTGAGSFATVSSRRSTGWLPWPVCTKQRPLLRRTKKLPLSGSKKTGRQKGHWSWAVNAVLPSLFFIMPFPLYVLNRPWHWQMRLKRL